MYVTLRLESLQFVPRYSNFHTSEDQSVPLCSGTRYPNVDYYFSFSVSTLFTFPFVLIELTL